MKTKITHYLKQLEQDKDIKILLACETGSRTWEFSSPDSDYYEDLLSMASQRQVEMEKHSKNLPYLLVQIWKSLMR